MYLSESLRGEPVGLTPVDDRYWSIQYGPLHIGVLDSYLNRALHTPTLVLPICPVAQWGPSSHNNPNAGYNQPLLSSGDSLH